jgi:hypothetical protein
MTCERRAIGHFEVLADGTILIDGQEFPYPVEGIPGVEIRRDYASNPIVRIELECDRVTIHDRLSGSWDAEAASVATDPARQSGQGGDAR